MAFRYAAADVTNALDSVSQICDARNTVVFTSEGGYVIGPRGRHDFDRVGDTYVRSTWVRRPRSRKKPNDKQNTMQTDQSAKMDVVVDIVENNGKLEMETEKGSAFGRPGPRCL